MNDKKTILLVEDETLLAMSEKMALEQYGYTVQTVNTGEKAVAAANTTPDIDLILMDINLGSGIDGTQAAEIILKAHDMPIVFVSSHSEREIVEKTEKITSYGYVVKNSSITVLDASIKMAFKLFDAKKREQKKEKDLRESEKRIQKKLNALTSFETSISDLELADIIDVDTIQSLMDDFYEFTKFPVAIIDLEGKVLVQTGWQDICTKFHRMHPETLKNCIECDTILTKNVPAGDFKSYLCKNNLWDNVTPLMIGGSHVGNLFTGQFFYEGEKPDDSVFYSQAEKYGFEKKEYMDAVRRVPVWKREVANIGLGLYAKLAHTISALSHSNLSLAKALGEQKGAEETLRESEERYRTILQTAIDGYWLSDTQGNILDVNESYCKMSGYCKPELLTMHISDIVVSESVDAISKRIHRITQEGSERFTASHQRKDGSIFDVEVSVQHLPIEGDHIVFFFRDVTEQNKAEEALRKSEQEYRKLFDDHSAVKFIIDFASGAIVKANKAATAFYGWSCEVLQGMNIGQINTQYSSDIIGEFSRIKTDKLERYETIHRKADGSLVSVEVYPHLIEYLGRKCIDSIVFDITDRKIAEHALKESESRLSRAESVAKIGNWKIDLERKLIIASDGASMIYGVQSGTLSLEYIQKCALPEYRPMLDKELSLLLNEGKPYKTEYKILRPIDSKIVDIQSIAELDKESMTVYGVILDITDRIEAEKTMRESERKYRFLIESSSDAIFCVDEQGQYQFTNHLFASTFGKTPDYFIGKTFWDIYPKDHADFRQSVSKKVFETGESQSAEVVVPLANKTLHFLAKANPIKDETGQVILNLTHATDITDRKQAEEMAKSLLSEKELALKEIHHRIKNNMNTISSLLSLQVQTLKEPLAIDALEDAIARVRSMRILYDKLYCSDNFNELSIKDYLPSLIDEIISNFPNSQIVKVEKSIQDITLDAKHLQPLGIIINELLTNIMKYAFKERASGLISVYATKFKGHVAISVQDDGKSIPESVSFENSTGFGLQLVHALTQQLEGAIRIERENGTKVVLEFEI